MCALVVAVYFPIPKNADQNTIVASDYQHLHMRRMQFARAALASGTLPAWYPRELMGTPFWSNVQSFPFIPTRLLLLTLDPITAIIYGAELSAVLAALFTFGFARSVGVSRVGAAAAGWTFACAGFYASRVMAGHLPLLEAYPALPLLLWLVERCASSPAPTRFAANLGVLALATLCVMLAGHPQLSIYAVAVSGIYLVYRTRTRWRTFLQTAAAMALGAACSAFALWPMAQLVARSTRVLPAMKQPENDVAFPYGRLLAFLFPWRDGWPELPLGVTGHPFTKYPVDWYFWDTVCYVGWVPLLAAAFLVLSAILRRRRPSAVPPLEPPAAPSPPWGFILLVGVVALVTALPVVHALRQALPGTILRSPARQVYITTFCLAFVTGVGIDAVLRRGRRRGGRAARAALAVVALALAAHAVDLGRHARAFVRPIRVPADRDPPFERSIRQFVGDGRVGIDMTLALPFNREIDDVGFFDSIMLAKPYAALMDLTGAAPGTNVQYMMGSEMMPRALASTGTRLVISQRNPRPDLKLVSGKSILPSYAVPGALPRAAFFPAPAVLKLDTDEIHRRLRDVSYDVGARVMLAAGAPEFPPTTAPANAAPLGVAYARPSSDEIVVRARATGGGGVLRVLESWDIGWSATVDGMPVDVLCADDAFLAAALPPGDHEVRFTYATPGATTGIGISLASLCLLGALAVSVAKREQRVSTATAGLPTSPP
jgi:hypothetical protein